MFDIRTLALIRRDELQRFRDASAAKITLAGISPLERCHDDRHDITDCPNSVCRWSGECAIAQQDYADRRKRRH